MQPLSRVKPDALVEFGLDESISKRPALGIKVAQCIAHWAEIEALLGILLATFLETETAAAVNIYASVENRSAQRRILMAAAEAKLTPEQVELFTTILAASVTPLMKQRDKLAHWLWLYSDDLPDDLILVRPSGKILNRLTRGYREPYDPEWENEAPEILKDAFVISDKYLTDLIASALGARKLLHWFGVAIWAGNTQELRAEYLQKLLDEPQIREALHRAREGQKTPQ